MAKQHTTQLRTQAVGFAVSALVAFAIFGTAAWWWTRPPGTPLPDGPVYQSGRIVGMAVGVRSVGAGQVHFAEITDADGLLQRLGKFEYFGSSLSISTIEIVRHPETGSGVRLLRVVAKAE
jgi:hypothetical protein